MLGKKNKFYISEKGDKRQSGLCLYILNVLIKGKGKIKCCEELLLIYVKLGKWLRSSIYLNLGESIVRSSININFCLITMALPNCSVIIGIFPRKVNIGK